jgi:glucosamine--fructose-6-phosphate aminotransferase (isomerizing)
VTQVDGHTEPGRLMREEMAEQPEILARFAGRWDELVEQIRGAARRPAGVAFLGRGSSDNAATLGRYAIEVSSGLPTSLVAPSVFTAYDRQPDRFGDWLLIALSQSGETPEILTVAKRFNDAGARVVSVTNHPASELAAMADLNVDVGGGTERAVPATKTVTGQMLACLAIARALGEEGLTTGDVRMTADAVAAVLADDASARDIAQVVSGYERLAVVGRGWHYAAALETALKLQETTGAMAHGFSSADFRHGPIAVCGPDAPAVLLAGSGPADDDTRALAETLTARGAQVMHAGTDPAATAMWPALGHAGECLLATVRGQQVAYHSSRLRGVDPDEPSGLTKVTLTH